MSNSKTPEKLGIVVGGGPAPGINGVISAVTIEAIVNGLEVSGFIDGFKHLVKGNTNNIKNLSIDDVKGVHLKGGSILGTSRTNPAKNDSDMNQVIDTFKKLGITKLVTIGGDDTAFSASQVYLKAAGSIRVAHVPKTIDNDLPLPPSTPTFGFETARHYGVNIVRSLCEDAKTTSRWYLVISMGRAAGHLALGIGKASAATLTIIPEEFQDRDISLEEVCDIILGSILKRRKNGSNHGVAVLAEGLLEKIGEKGLSKLGENELGRYGKVERDPHGHLRLGEIEFGRMVKNQLAAKLEELGVNLTIIDKDLGYELRCADPIPFDAEYTRDLGYGAVKFLHSTECSKYGAVISFIGGKLQPIPFENIINPATRRMKTRLVDVKSEGFECARRYMIRLDKSDFDDQSKLEALAKSLNWSPEQFKKRFGYLVGI
ncbi:MAG: diphosphate--fructose-6-phosphate 1-phosphotransferase [Gemmataceae bacterium]|jgi:6-phosphofructokinase 1